MSRLLILTYIPSPYQVELFNAIARSNLFSLKVAYLYSKSNTAIAKLWQQSNIQHEHLILNDCEANYQQLEAEIPHRDLFVFNYYRHPRINQLIERCIAHNIPWCFWGERPGFKHDGWLGYLYRRYQLSKLHSSNTAIWGVGSWGVKQYRREFGSNREYINFPYFSDLTRFQIDRKPDTFSQTTRTFLYSGALIHRKGVDLLATAFNRLAAEFPHVRLHLVGEGELKSELAAKFAKYSDRVCFCGFQTWDKLPQHYHQADILCAPSRYDGWALVIPEGLAAGLPVIGTNRTGAVLDLVKEGNNGWIIPTNNAEALYQAMKEAAKLDSTELKQYSQAATASVKHHSLTDGVSKFQQAVRQTLKVHRRSTMKVLHIIPSIAPVRGGPGHAAIDTVKALQDLGVEAEIVTTNDNGVELLDVPLGKLIEYKGVPVRFFPRFNPPLNFVKDFVFSWELTKWLQSNIESYDLVHLHLMFNYPCTAAMIIARQKNIPYILRPNGLLCNWSLQQKSLKKQIYLKLIEKANLDRARAVEYTAKLEREEAKPLNLTSPNFVLPYGLYLPQPIANASIRLRQRLNIPEQEPIILFMSRLHHKKGLEYLIPALQKINHRSFTFAIAGSGDPAYEAEIVNLLKTNEIYDRTHLAGFVTGEDKDLFLQGADIFALTSHSESFGLAVLEAIAAGLKVITTPGVPLASVVKEHQLGIVTHLDINAIADAIEQSLIDLNNPELTQARQKRSHQLISGEYTWESVATEMKQIYQTIIEDESSEVTVTTPFLSKPTTIIKP